MGERGASDSYVYLYRDATGPGVRYVGFGHRPARALSHAAHSHNDDLERWLSRGQYRLEIAGPYPDARSGLAVEAALISAIRPQFNRSPGTGPTFVPMGVPPNLADRVLEPRRSEEELARLAGGALFVYLSDGTVMTDGRMKANSASPDTQVLVAAAEAWWQIGPLLDYWRSRPEQTPETLVAVHGPAPRSRFVLGSFRIDVRRLLTGDLERQASGLWHIPLADRDDADAAALRGRRFTEIRFGRGRREYFHWVDGSGTTRWNGRDKILHDE